MRRPASRRTAAWALAALGALVAVAPAARATTRRVPDDFATIAAALAASTSGDSVTVAPGTYTESLVLPSGVTLAGTGAPGAATIAAAGPGAVIDAVNPAFGTRLAGLTLSGGTGVNDGGLTEGGDLRVLGGRLEADDCTFSGGQAAFGGGTAGIGATLVFRRCAWSAGNATYGAGHFQTGGGLTLDACAFSGGTAAVGGGLYANGGAHVTVGATTFTGCQATGDGGGLWFDSAVATLSDVRVDATRAGGHGGGLAIAAGGQVLASASVWVDTQSGAGGGAFWVSCAAGAPAASARTGKGPAAMLVSCALLSLTHCDVIRALGAAPAAGGVTDAAELDVQTSIVAGNASGLACLDPRATLAVSCSDLYQNGGADVSGPCAPPPGANLLAVDPYLCDLAGRDFGLCANSPLLAPPACDSYWGAAGQACAACGPTPTAVQTWGRVKARYRR